MAGSLLLLGSCNSDEAAIALSTTSVTVAPTTVAVAESDPLHDVPAESGDANLEERLTNAMTNAIAQLDWPDAYRINAQALWASKLAPAAADTMLGDVDAVQLVEAWNMCAWSLEISESVETHDQPRIDAAMAVLEGLESRFLYTSSSGLLDEMTQEAAQGSTSSADSFTSANDCQDWPTE